MTSPPPRVRVAAYVIRRHPSPALLVFDQVAFPEAGTQVPAGGVAPGEDPEPAVLREVAEETGLRGARVVRRIAVDGRPHPDTGQPRLTTCLLLDAPPDGPAEREHRVRGDGGDAGMRFVCRFAPLPLAHPLADAQDAHLRRVDPRWVARGEAAGPPDEARPLS
ncbi:NUDIX hydrolase [Streptomyces globisporus]|uniref:NUDIX domain-containing protein n=1 Tax=Streptomyces globisporus TaxID=1908 RepID=A0A423UZQ1_STRGL|nr:NUDIX domain-containing protein [Streptomyces globisporus]ROV67799.1 NUDIX domain-containing protein [Streptomyces globisporus]